MKPRKFPVKDAAVWQELNRVSPYRALKTHFRHLKITLMNLGPRPDSKLRKHSGSFAPLTRDDLPLICVVKNANNYIRAFLRHYRELGVTRFVIVDDRSSDGTTEVLAAAHDVDLYTSDKTFHETELGVHWRDALLAIYGHDRWYISVDADEFLVFPGSETRNIRAFIGDLESRGYDRCLAVMLDTYPPGALDAVAFHDDGQNSPFDVSSHFDGDNYTIKHERYGTAVRGGPRKRLFGRDMRQVKFPLFNADRATDYRRGSIHGLGPVIRNFVPVTAVLLHYRFSAHSVDEFRRIVENYGEIEHGGAHYSAILKSSDFSESFSLAYEGSARYKDSQDLVDRGFMMDLRG